MPKEEEEEFLTLRENDIRWQSHDKVHDVHATSHVDMHVLTKMALEKADEVLEKRLEGMNEFRAQLERQAGAFITREIYETYIKEQALKFETALSSSTEKYDALISAIVARHDADTDSTREQIQNEREVRKTFEGAMNTWKWIASFLGASGVAGVILLFATR